MNHSYKLVAMIPARLGSKRIPKKNIRYLYDKPLIQYAIDLAKQSDAFDSIWVNTESEELGKIVESMGVSFHRRPAELAIDTATNRDFTYEFLKKHDCDYVVMVNSTSPALRKETMDKFIRFIQENDFDTILSVEDIQTVSYFRGEPVNFNPGEMIQSQRLEPIRGVAWALTAWRREHFIRLQESGECPVFAGKVGLFTIPKDESVDLDNEEDWNIAEGIMEARRTRITREKRYIEL